MKKIFLRSKEAMLHFTVGPSQVYPTLYKHLQKAMKEDVPSMSHRGSEFKKLYRQVEENLKKLLGIPKEYEIYFVSSALEAFERSLMGTVERVSLHILTGSFGKAWYKFASDLGKKPQKVEVEAGEGIDLSKLKIQKEVELICITQNDTSTGIALPMEEIHALKLHNPKKLIALDVVSSIPYVDIDFEKIDITLFSVQKGFGLPAGLGIMVVSPEALEKGRKLIQKGISIGSYHSLLNLSEKYQDFQTPETPNVLNIYLLNNVLKDMLKKGIEKIRRETDQKAKLFYDFFSKHPVFDPFVKEDKYYSKTSLVFDVKGQSKKIRDRLSKKGFLVGAGYGANSENHIRIANFPAHPPSSVKRLLSLL